MNAAAANAVVHQARALPCAASPHAAPAVAAAVCTFGSTNTGYAGQWRTWQVGAGPGSDDECSTAGGPAAAADPQLIDDSVNIRLWRTIDAGAHKVQQSNLYQVRVHVHACMAAHELHLHACIAPPVVWQCSVQPGSGPRARMLQVLRWLLCT